MKTCSKCGHPKDDNDFYLRRYKITSGEVRECRDSKCKVCAKAASAKQREGPQRENYLAYQQEYRKTTGKQKRQERFAWLDTLKAKPCEDCTNSFPPECMDFDHKDPSTKLFDVSHAVVSGYSVDSVLIEVAKCRLICANCHRIRTAKQQGRRSSNGR